MRKQHKEQGHKLRQEQQEEMARFRESLFRQITRDLRTPITVIAGASDQLAAKTTEIPSELQLIQANISRLIHQIRYLQDLSLLEAGQLKLQLEQGDIIPHLQQLVDSWHFPQEDLQIELDFLSELEHFIMDFDRVRLIYLVSHLLDQAYRQNPQGKLIKLEVAVEIAEQQQEKLKLRLINRLPSKAVPMIEEEGKVARNFITKLLAFMQADLKRKVLVKEGTYHQTLRLVVTRKAPKAEPIKLPAAEIIQATNIPEELILEHEDAPLILIAEDHPDLVNLLSQILGEQYNLMIARNGQQGIDLALRHVPDIMITDVMMPQKDGYELCYTLKNHESTSHIPIIMMSAKTGKHSRLTGLRQGADVYLEKPFQPEELEAIVDSLLEQRRRLQSYYLSVSGLSEEGLSRPSSDLPDQLEDAFLKKVRQLIEEQLEQQDFSVEQLSQLLFMDPSNLYRKVKALTGLSPLQYIQSLRLRHAKQLLRESDESIISVALSSGFNSAGYFSRVFKKDTGMTPSAYREQLK